MATRGYENFTAADAARVGRQPATLPSAPRSKYGAVKVTIDGVTFDSKAEGRRYQELKALEAAGEIWELELQPVFPLTVPSTTGTIAGAAKALAGTFRGRIGEYRADFKYYDKATVGYVVEDVKGFKTPLYRWKKKHVEAQYGIRIREIR